MKKRIGFSVLFYTIGTFILIGMSGIVALNFSQDSRLLGRAVMAEVKDTGEKQANNDSAPVPDNNGTLIYEKENVNNADSKDSDKEQSNNTPDEEKKEEPIKVEIINCTSDSSFDDHIKGVLQAVGISVALVSDSSERRKDTVIIVRSEKDSGGTLQGLINAGSIISEPDPKSKIDATIKLGEDMLP